MDRNSIVGYLLIFLIFAGYLFYTSKNTAEIRRQQAIEDSIAHADAIQDSLNNPVFVEETPAIEEESSADTSEADPEVAETVQVPEVIHELQNAKIRAEVSTKGGRITEVELKDYRRSDENKSKLILFTKDDSKFDFTIPLKSGVVQTANLDFEITESDSSHVILSHKVDGGEIRHVYTLDEKYLVGFDLELVGLNDKIARKHNSFDMTWGIKAPLQERSVEDERNVSTIYYKYLNENDVDYISERGYEEETLQTNIHWISFKQKFFMSTLIFPEGLKESGTTIETAEVTSDAYVKDYSSSFTIPYDFSSDYKQSVQFYFGPNHYQTLKRLDVKLEKSISLGWGIIGWVNKFLVIPIFNWLSNFSGNYGLIILLLTLIIKGLLIAPMYKIYVSSAKMKLLKPELEEIKERTGGDMQKMQQEQMKLYKKAGVSPFGGCLPQLIQFPILIALFRFFPSSIELRHKAFLWADDLSTYDSIFTFPNGFEIPWYGDHISLFTLLMAGSSILYTLYNSQSTAMTGQMKWIMYLMPVMLLVWFNSYSAGLSYYYFLANMMTFGQNFIFKTFIVDEEKLHKQMEANKKKKVKVKKSRFQKRLEEMAKKRGIDPNQVNRRK